MKKQEGITLIALVITIIVLLILAGVTIAMLAGDNGILTRATSSRAQSALGDAKDKVSMLITEEVSHHYEEKYVNSNTSLKDVTATAAAGEVLSGITTDSLKVSGVTVKSATTTKIILVYSADNTAVTGTLNGDTLQWAEGEH